MVENKEHNKKLVAGVGSALVDILARVDDEFIEKIKAPKGGMIYVESEFIEKTLLKVTGEPDIVPGGSACNTIVGIANLGGPARFVGKLGADKLGIFFKDYLKKNNIDAMIFSSQTPTGRVMSCVTPDAQRTMLTFLGASAETSPEEITEECFKDAAVVHIEGYMLFSEELLMKVLKEAKKAGARISLDLASYTIVESFKELIEIIIRDYVDILIANEDEARVFTGCEDEQGALESLAKQAETAVLKVGKRGSYIAEAGRVIKNEPFADGAIIDTTGAGDLWASGFLYGLVNNFPLEDCGKLASACGYEVCRVLGANIPDDGWNRIRKLLESMEAKWQQ